MTDKNVFDPLLNVGDVNEVIFKPMFTKITMGEAKSKPWDDLSAGKCLRNLDSIIKLMERLVTDALIYCPNKEFLVNLANNRNSIILQKLKENSATLRIICDMDRRFRTKQIKHMRAMSFQNTRRSILPLLKEQGVEIKIEKDSKRKLILEKPKKSLPKSNVEISYFDPVTMEVSKPAPDIVDLTSTESETIQSQAIPEESIEALYCYYGDEPFPVDKLEASIAKSTEIDAVVDQLIADEYNGTPGNVTISVIPENVDSGLETNSEHENISSVMEQVHILNYDQY